MSVLTVPMPVDVLVALCDGLPTYTELTLVGQQGRSTFNLMARDIARPGRRYTNLTTGSEVLEGLDQFVHALDVTEVEVFHASIAVVRLVVTG